MLNTQRQKELTKNNKTFDCLGNTRDSTKFPRLFELIKKSFGIQQQIKPNSKQCKATKQGPVFM